MEIASPKKYADVAAFIRAESPDYASFVFSEPQLRKSSRAFHQGFDGLVTYAVKANPARHVLKILVDEGMKAFDVASVNEMALVREIAPEAALHYNNPIRSQREIETAWNTYQVRSYSIDGFSQLDRIAEIVPPSRDVEITVRFKTRKAKKSWDFGTKFGAAEEDAVELARSAEERGYSASLCFHVGSQCEDVKAYARHIATAGRIAEAAGITLKRLNVGGGFPAAYPSSTAPELDAYFETIRKAVKKTFGKQAPELIVEPGRAMVTPCTSLLLRVKHRRRADAVYLNDGTYGALMEIQFMPIVPPVRVWRGDKIVTGETAPFVIFGPTCDSHDALPQHIHLPVDVAEDDWIEFGLMGAYTQASLTDFNGFSKRLQFWADDILV